MKKKLLLASGLTLAVNAFAITVTYDVTPTTLGFGDPGYTVDGSIVVSIVESDDCTGGTYTVTAAAVLGSGPSGSTPPGMSIGGYIGFPSSWNFVFNNAGLGDYTIITTTTACAEGTPPAPVEDVVTVGSLAPPPGPRAIPTLSLWGVMLMSGVMALIGIGARRRR